MMDCNYCTNYFLNLNNRVDDSCMGHNDIRKPYFSCNEKLNPKWDDAQEMIEKLRKKGYKITK